MSHAPVNTLPLETLAAYRNHGEPVPRLTEGAAQACETLRRLAELGIDLNASTQQLEHEGIEKFTKAFGALMQTLKEKQARALSRSERQLTRK